MLLQSPVTKFVQTYKNKIIDLQKNVDQKKIPINSNTSLEYLANPL
jgi:hypothetical protein